jgi:hypothetical protein
MTKRKMDNNENITTNTNHDESVAVSKFKKNKGTTTLKCINTNISLLTFMGLDSDFKLDWSVVY